MTASSADIVASCPARIDIGNSLDYPGHFFSLPSRRACTANIAVDLRTTVTWSERDRPGVRIETETAAEEHPGSPALSETEFPLVAAVLHHFRIETGAFRIETDVPFRSGIGGSGILLIALLGTMLEASGGTQSDQTHRSILITAHLMENWLGFSRTGFHDQLAALHGGANLWTWGTDLLAPAPWYTQRSLLDDGGCEELERHLLLAYTGEPHAEIAVTGCMSPLPDAELGAWEEVARLTCEFADALTDRRWADATRALNDECDLRTELRPDVLSARAIRLVREGRAAGVGCRYAGHGHGGCVWACGDERSISALEPRWRAVVRDWPGAWVITPPVATDGLEVGCVP